MNRLKQLIVTLKNRNLAVATAESSSGGYLSYLLTKTPGSSKVFKGGLIVYSLESKNKLLRIPNPLLNKTKGVSSNIAVLLAKRTRQLFKVDIALSIVGFASSPARKGVKPGSIFIAIADKSKTTVKKIIIKGSRDHIRKQASLMAIKLLYKKISGIH